MADIELIIKIDENWYKACQHAVDNPKMMVDEMHIAIENGIPLLKGHGKLVDVGQCDRKLFYKQCGGADSLITVKSAFDMLMSLSAIIEADKEN